MGETSVQKPGGSVLVKIYSDPECTEEVTEAKSALRKSGMENTAAYYEKSAIYAATTEPVTTMDLHLALIYATLCHAAAVAEQNEILLSGRIIIDARTSPG